MPATRVTVKLRKAQKRALKVLGTGFKYTRVQISEKASIDPAWVGAAIGPVDPDTRKQVENKTGYPSLVTIGYATVRTVDVCGDVEVLYQITAAGRKALERGEAN